MKSFIFIIIPDIKPVIPPKIKLIPIKGANKQYSIFSFNEKSTFKFFGIVKYTPKKNKIIFPYNGKILLDKKIEKIKIIGKKNHCKNKFLPICELG